MRQINASDRGFPADAPDLGSTLFSTINIGTSLTNVFTISSLDPGDYYWSMNMWAVHVGSPTGFALTTGFTGTATAVGWAGKRYPAPSGSVAVSLHNAFGATLNTTIFSIGEFDGYFRSTTVGDLTMGCTRTAGTSSTIQIASHIEVYKIS